ncbi:MAG: hypothetical protein ACP5NW_02290 [Candidatus Woesearchaeota archaeon]
MFIFQYDGLHQKLFPGGRYPDKKIIDAGLDSIIDLSNDYIGEKVVVIFDNNHDIRSKYAIEGDLVRSTFRQGVLKQITGTHNVAQSVILFEDAMDGKKVLEPIKTIRLIDMVSIRDLSYPTQAENGAFSRFFFKLFYHRRGETGLLHFNPLGAFIEGRSKILRPGNECKQAYFTGFQSLSEKIEYDEGAPERCTSEYEKMLRQGSVASKKTYVIRCGK